MNDFEAITAAILSDYSLGRDIDRMGPMCLPDKARVNALIEDLLRIIFPCRCCCEGSLSRLIEDTSRDMHSLIAAVCRNEDQARTVCPAFFNAIPAIRATVQTDVQAAFDGDPAASGKDEIIFAYPGLYAITVYRLAHELYRLEVPMLPRMMTELAHSATGIDIHPGADIGEAFFIDHGTGIVIGQTTVIGDRVKIYQGVTLGGLSTRGGQSLRDTKRHPTIEDDVTIYAGATILGGGTVIGQGCVICANAFITQSVAPHTRVNTETPLLQYKAIRP